MTNYQAVNRQSSKGLTSASWASAPQPTPQRLKRRGHVNLLSSPSVPVETDRAPYKGYTLSLQG